MKRHPLLSFERIHTNSVYRRTNLVTIKNMARPYEDELTKWPRSEAEDNAFNQLVDHIIEARAAGKPVIWSMGAHVIKNGLSRYVIEMVRHGILTHVSGNGATSIHDFELAFLGETSEDVATAIEDGSFGMWEETGRYMNEAIQQGVASGLGYGESLYRYLEQHPDQFPHYEDCVFVQCQLSGVPYTCHISIGTDIIHQHPIVNFESLGRASGQDFTTICQSIAGLDQGGVFLNFGSAISGPELFLKGVSIARNAGLSMEHIVAANFDIVPVSAANKPLHDEAGFYYRPRRNFIDLLPEIEGSGQLFHGLHQETIPQLFHRILTRKQQLGITFLPAAVTEKQRSSKTTLYSIANRHDQCHLHHIKQPQIDQPLAWEAVESNEFKEMIHSLRTIYNDNHTILVNVGGNVIGSGQNLYLIDMIRSGMITHLALNGAAAFQDFELAAFGQTEERLDGGLKERTLGMWEEPGRLLHDALQAGYASEHGYGESLMAFMEQSPDQFPYRSYSLLYACLQQGIPCTVHITLGTDAIQQHPAADFAVQGGASGLDFRAYAQTVSQLDGGAFLNFGSTVTGPEVFLKALSIARNLGHTVNKIMTVNFDIVKLGNYHKKVGYEDWDYYYRPRKNIIHRPTSLGGTGYHFEGMHQETIPAIWKMLKDVKDGVRFE